MGIKIIDYCHANGHFDYAGDHNFCFSTDAVESGNIRIHANESTVFIELHDWRRTPLYLYHIGQCFYTGERKWMVVEQSKETTAALSLDPLVYLDYKTYDSYASAKGRLNKLFLTAVKRYVSDCCIVSHTTKIKTEDGNVIEKYKEKASILTFEQYKRYQHIIPINTMAPFALSTPHIIGDSKKLLYVKEDGSINEANGIPENWIYPFVVFDNNMEPLTKKT